MSVPHHPPAAGGKTAWGVGELITTTGEDTEELQTRRRKAAEFNDREQKRLHGLRDMDSQALDIQERRRERQRQWENGLTSNGSDDFKSKQLEILRKLEENREKRKLEKKEKMINDPAAAKKKREKKKEANNKKKKKKKKQSSSSSSSKSSSSSSSGSSSSSSGKKVKKEKKAKVEKVEKVVVPQVDPQVAAAMAAEQRAKQMEIKRRADEAKARERAVKDKAKAALAAHAAEEKAKEAAAAAKREADAKKKVADAEAKKKDEVKRKKEEEEERKRAEDEKKNTPEAIARRKAAEEAASKVKSGVTDTKGKSVRELVAGGFYQGQHVVAARDITIRGSVIVRSGTAGKIIGRADTDPMNRAAVKFIPRADGGTGLINCVPGEIRKG